MANALVGTWRLVAYELWSNGEVSYPMGRDAVGYISYDAQGRMSVQLMRAGRPPLASGRWSDGTLDELRAAGGGFLSYGGSYEVNEPEATVTHHIDVHLLPNAIGSRLVRRYAVHGTRLTLLTSPTAAGARPEGGRLTWELVR